MGLGASLSGDARGFSLAEVVVALGVLASVLISVAGLLVVGSRLVRNGRGTSEALSVARDLMEEMQGWGYRQTFSVLGCNEAMELCQVEPDDPPLTPWRDQVRALLHDGEARVRVQSLEPGVSLGDAQAVRVTVLVSWRQDQRTREIRVGMVRM